MNITGSAVVTLPAQGLHELCSNVFKAIAHLIANVLRLYITPVCLSACTGVMVLSTVLTGVGTKFSAEHSPCVFAPCSYAPCAQQTPPTTTAVCPVAP